MKTYPTNGALPFLVSAALLILCQNSFVSADDILSDALKAVQSVKINGEGHESATKAMKVLNAASAEQIPAILTAMDGANSISENWLRAAVNSIVRRDNAIPRQAIESYFADNSHSSMGRLLAFELLTSDNEDLAKQMIANSSDETCLPLRKLAIANMIKEADDAAESNQLMAIGKLGMAFNKARDVGQLESITKKLGEMGISVNLQKQMGFINEWNLVGSFDNKEMKGFDVAYGPEEAIGMLDLNATYKDQDGNPAKWQTATTAHSTGNLDLNSIIGKNKGAIIYALGNFKAAEEGDAQIRIGTANAHKIWLNGDLVMVNEVYHNSNSVDKFITDIKLKKGDNQIFMKICQNEQTQPWAQDWQFQVRICDASGKAIEAAQPPPSNY